MSKHDVLVIGASAGGVEALSRLFRSLPAGFPGSLFVVLHTVAAGESRLPEILNRAGPLRAKHPEDNEAIAPGTVYVARPNYHLAIEDGRVRSVTRPKQNGHRPSVNVLFESAARAWGERVAGVILSGSLDDGTLGLLEIKRVGGAAIVQDPREAMFTGMPQSALNRVEVDFSGSVSEIASHIVQIATTGEEVTAAAMSSANEQTRVSGAESGQVAGFSCPECGGVLTEERTGEFLHFRCHVGHRLTEGSLLQSQSAEIESALWTALRVLEERMELADRVARRAGERGNTRVVTHFEQQNRDARRKADIIRRALLGDGQEPSVTSLQDGVPELVPANGDGA